MEGDKDTEQAVHSPPPAAGPPKGVAQTMFATQAVGLAQQFGAVMSKHQLGTERTYRLELSAPEGPSTGGGKQSLQHVKLVPTDNHGTIVMGSADQKSKEARLRTWDHIEDAYRARYRQEPPFSRRDYVDVYDTVQKFFIAVQYTVSPEPFVQRRATRKASKRRSSSAWKLWLAVALAAIGAGLVTGWLLL